MALYNVVVERQGRVAVRFRGLTSYGMAAHYCETLDAWPRDHIYIEEEDTKFRPYEAIIKGDSDDA